MSPQLSPLSYQSVDKFPPDFPELESEDIRACLAFAAEGER